MQEKSANKENKKIVIYWSVRKIVTLICAILIVPALIVFLFSLTLKTTVINPEYYKNNLKEINTYDRIVNQGIPSLILEMHISDNELTDSLARELSILLIQKLVDPTWIEQLTDEFIDKTANYFQNPGEGISLDLTSSQYYLNKLSTGLVILEQVIPDCKQTSNDSSVTKTASLLNLSLDCSKMSTNLDEIKSDLSGIKQQVDNINLGVVEFDQTVKKANTFIQTVNKFLRYVNVYLWASLILMIILTSVIIVLQWKNTTLIFKSISFFSGVGSFFTLTFGFLANKLIPTNLLDNQQIVLSPTITDIINDFLQVTITGIFHQLEIYATILFLISLLVYFSTLVIEKKGIRFFK